MNPETNLQASIVALEAQLQLNLRNIDEQTAMRSLIQAALQELDNSLSQWVIHHHPERLQQTMARLQELAVNHPAIEALEVFIVTLYGDAKQGAEQAFAYLSTHGESTPSPDASTKLEWLVHLALCHYYVMAGHVQPAQHHAGMASHGMPAGYHHLKGHLQNLVMLGHEHRHRQVFSMASHCSKSYYQAKGLMSGLLHLTPHMLQKNCRVMGGLFHLLWLELVHAPYPQLAQAFQGVLQKVHLHSVVIHAAQFELSNMYWKNSLMRLKRAIRRMPSQPLLWLELAHTYSVLSHKEKAFTALQKTVSLMPSLTLAQMELGLACAERQHMTQALEHYMMAYLHAPDAQTKRKVAFLITNLLETPLSPDAPLLLMGGEDPHSIWREWAAEVALLLKLEQEAQPTAATLSHLAKFANSLGQNTLAVALCEMACHSAGGNNAQCLVNLAFSLWQGRKVQQARYIYHKALLEDADNAIAHNNVGSIYLDELSDIATAETHFKRAIEQNPHYAMAHFNLGRVYAIRNQYTEAAQAFASAKATNLMTQELDAEEINHYMHQLFDKM